MLPIEAQEMLRRAAATSAEHGPFERTKAIDRAIDAIRRMYPELFRNDT